MTPRTRLPRARILAPIVATAAVVLLLAGCITAATSSEIPLTGASVPATSGPPVFRADGLSLAVPATWRRWDIPLPNVPGQEGLAVFTQGDGPWCTSSPSPSSGAATLPCPVNGQIPQDSMLVELLRSDFLASLSPADSRAQRVGGQTAYFQEAPTPGSWWDLTLTWAIQRPGGEEGTYVVFAALRGPDLQPMRDGLARVLASATIAPWRSPAPSASDGLAHFASSTLSLDYPVEWQQHFVADSMVWLTTFPPPADCCNGFNQPAGTVGFSVRRDGGAVPFNLPSFRPNTTVDGLPASFTEQPPDPPFTYARRLSWVVIGPGSHPGDYIPYYIDATIRDPGEAAYRTQVEQVVASIKVAGSTGFVLPSPT